MDAFAAVPAIVMHMRERLPSEQPATSIVRQVIPAQQPNGRCLTRRSAADPSGSLQITVPPDQEQRRVTCVRPLRRTISLCRKSYALHPYAEKGHPASDVALFRFRKTR